MNKVEALQTIQSKMGVDASAAEGVYSDILGKTGGEYALLREFWANTSKTDEDREASYVTGALDVYINEKGATTMPDTIPVPQISSNPLDNDLSGQSSGSMTAATGKKTIEKSALALPTLNAETKGVISGLLRDDHVKELLEASRNTAITKLLVQRPNPSSYLRDSSGQPYTVVPEAEAEKLAEWEKQLVDEPANIQAFEQVKAAVLNRTPMPVYVNDDGNKRVVGAIVRAASGNEIVLTINALKGYLLTDVLGRIPGSPGVYLSKWEEQKHFSTQGAIEKRTTTLSLKWQGRDAAIKAGAVDFISKPADAASAAEKGFDGVVDTNARVRIATAFSISTTSIVNGVAKTVKRTKRLTGRTDFMPYFVLRQEFLGIFSDTKKKDAVELPQTPEEMQAALETLQIGYGAIAVGSFSVSADMKSNNARLQEIVQNLATANASGSTGSIDL